MLIERGFVLIDKNTSQLVEWFKHEDKKKAYEKSLKIDCYMQPFLTPEAYSRIPKDYVGKSYGVPYLLYLDHNESTVYGPVKLVDKGVEVNALTC